jgi:hypothetical protein
MDCLPAAFVPAPGTRDPASSRITSLLVNRR